MVERKARSWITRLLAEREDVGAKTAFSLLSQFLHAALRVIEFRLQPVLLMNGRHLHPVPQHDHGLPIDIEPGDLAPLAPNTDLHTLHHDRDSFSMCTRRMV